MIAPRHKWGEPLRFAAEDCPNGCEQTERRCLNGCGTVRITVHPPNGRAWIEWRTSDPGHAQRQLPATPPCRAEPVEAHT